MAISVLSAGFDYAHVRLVIHINKLLFLVDFAQESSQAGQDGKEAYSLVLLLFIWKPQAAKSTAVERKTLHYYLLG
jgi:superfamily II DNA helicase RecQ